jgi:3-oxoacyl-[acyl-carrier-protein] synthase II
MQQSSPIAITGAANVCPLGWNDEEILQALMQHRSAIKLTDLGLDAPYPFASVADEFWDAFEDLGGLLGEERMRLARLDPGLAFGFFAARRALDAAKLDNFEGLHPERVACTVSSSKGFLRCYLQAHRQAMTSSSNWTLPSLGTGVRTFLASTLGDWIAQVNGFTGPRLSTSAACATGLVSVILGCRLIQDGIADVVLAGSAEYTRNPLGLAGFVNMGAFSAGPCLPFHSKRSGFNAGEGAAVFVLERLDHALGRGVEPLALIRGADYRSEAYHITAVEPGSETAEFAVRRALERAGWSPPDVEYINAHGTGTPLNDRAEAELIRRIFAPHAPLVSSLKGHIGHLLGASAGVELALALLALRHSFVPPTLGLDDPAPECSLHFVPPEGERRRIRRFMKFSLGFGGHVAILALELP